MDSDNLVRMANRIGVFFEAMPDRPEALEGIANHLRKFWDPRMRREFLVLVDTADSGVSDIVKEAVLRHRAALQPAAA
ncbi:MAG: formate dehydrogenase subunit delta [Ramlibacter sp.]|nr:formate dehydrogenase subunit delta [Ramlibacter sp.]MBX3657346.1 formate dehydrogenase subunit delta [Ramlibacter sp.]